MSQYSQDLFRTYMSGEREVWDKARERERAVNAIKVGNQLNCSRCFGVQMWRNGKASFNSQERQQTFCAELLIGVNNVLDRVVNWRLIEAGVLA